MQVSVQFLSTVLSFCRICFAGKLVESVSEISTGCWYTLAGSCVEIWQVFVIVWFVVLPRFWPAVLVVFVVYFRRLFALMCYSLTMPFPSFTMSE